MTVHVNIEYSVFDVPNPFAQLTPERMEQHSDGYIYVSPRATLKIRDNTKVKYKAFLRSIEGLDLFQHMTFMNDPQSDPLRSFLQFHHFTDLFTSTQKEFTLNKERAVYYLEGRVQGYFSTFDLQGKTHTNLTLSAREPQRIKDVCLGLGLTESNKSFASFLLDYVHAQPTLWEAHAADGHPSR